MDSSPSFDRQDILVLHCVFAEAELDRRETSNPLQLLLQEMNLNGMIPKFIVISINLEESEDFE